MADQAPNQDEQQPAEDQPAAAQQQPQPPARLNLMDLLNQGVVANDEDEDDDDDNQPPAQVQNVPSPRTFGATLIQQQASVNLRQLNNNWGMILGGSDTRNVMSIPGTEDRFFINETANAYAVGLMGRITQVASNLLAAQRQNETQGGTNNEESNSDSLPKRAIIQVLEEEIPRLLRMEFLAVGQAAGTGVPMKVKKYFYRLLKGFSVSGPLNPHLVRAAYIYARVRMGLDMQDLENEFEALQYAVWDEASLAVREGPSYSIPSGWMILAANLLKDHLVLRGIPAPAMPNDADYANLVRANNNTNLRRLGYTTLYTMDSRNAMVDQLRVLHDEYEAQEPVLFPNDEPIFVDINTQLGEYRTAATRYQAQLAAAQAQQLANRARAQGQANDRNVRPRVQGRGSHRGRGNRRSP